MNEKQSPRSGRRWLVVSAVALTSAVAAGLTLGLWQPEPQTITLADGTRASLVAVAQGPDGTLSGSPLQKLLYQILPPAYRDHTGVIWYGSGTSGWLHCWILTSPPRPELAATIFNELGDEAHGMAGEPHLGATAFSFESFPRRGRMIGVRLYSPQGSVPLDVRGAAPRWKPLGEFTVPRTQAPVTTRWTAPPLPVTARAGDLQLTLDRLEVGVAEIPNVLRMAGEEFATATVRLTRNGRPARGWYPDLEIISDATGNYWRPSAVRSQPLGDAIRLDFTTPPRRGEDVWKLKFLLERDTATLPLPDEVWSVRDLPIPRPGQVIPLKHKSRLQGVDLELIHVYGRGTVVPLETGAEPVTDGCALPIRLTGLPKTHVRSELWSVRDDQERDLDHKSASILRSYPEVFQLHKLYELKGSRTFDLKYLVQRAREVELTAPRTLLDPATPPDAVK